MILSYPIINFLFSFVLGLVFDQNSEEIQSAFKLAMLQYGTFNRTRLDFQVYVDIINTADAFKLSRLSKYNLLSLQRNKLVLSILI